MKIKSFLFFAFFSSFLFCTKSTTPEPIVTYTKADSGTTKTIDANKEFNIELNECVGCADVWKITQLDTTRIEYIGKAYSNPSCTNCVGGSHDATFSFKAIAIGSSTLELAYFSDTVRITIMAVGLD